MSVTHIAGLDVTIENRYWRQRCSWCGVVIDEYDLDRIAVQVEPCAACWSPALGDAREGTGTIVVGLGVNAPCPVCYGTGRAPYRPPGAWPIGHFVRIDGALKEALECGIAIPDDACCLDASLLAQWADGETAP